MQPLFSMLASPLGCVAPEQLVADTVERLRGAAQS
jgi:hypothetical protein